MRICLGAESRALGLFLSLCSPCCASCNIIDAIYWNIDKMCMKSIWGTWIYDRLLITLITLSWPSANHAPSQTTQKSAQELRRAVRELCVFAGMCPQSLPRVFVVCGGPAPALCVLWVSAAADPRRWEAAAGARQLLARVPLRAARSRCPCPVWAEQTAPQGLTS